MINFLSPIWLYSLLTLTIPIAIHLFSRRKGKRIRFGSLKNLKKSPSSQFRRLKLVDFLIMLLRLAVLAFLSMILAKPQWKATMPDSTGTAQKWVLLAPESYPNEYSPHIYQSIDSLINAGYEFHLFSKDFPELGLKETTPSIEYRDYWSLLRELNLLLLPNAHAVVFAQERLSWFRGERPDVNFNLTWLKTDSLAENLWIDKIKKISNKQYRTTIGMSDSTGVYYHDLIHGIPPRPDTLVNLALKSISLDLSNSGEVILNPLRPDINPSDDSTSPDLPVDTLTVAIFFDEDRIEDVRYVRSAIEALSEIEYLPASIQVSPETDDTHLDFDLAFFLSANKIPLSLNKVVESGASLVVDAASPRYTPTASHILNVLMNSGDGPVLRRTGEAGNNGITIWSDDFGRPVMNYQRLGKGSIYGFYSRFHPMWNELVLDPWFPIWVNNLISRNSDVDFFKENVDPSRDLRSIDSKQIMPNRIQADMVNGAPDETSDLHTIFWLLALTFFLVERWLSSKRTV